MRVDLSGLTKEQITALPEGLSVKNLYLDGTKISAENAMLLIAKLKPQGYLSLGYIDLSRLTEEQINALPEGLFVQDLFLHSTNISAKNTMFLIAKLKPRGNVNLRDVNLSGLKEEDIAVIPEGLSVKELSLCETKISAENAMLLIAKLKPQGNLNLDDVYLSELTEAHITALPEGLSVKTLSLFVTNISAKNAILLIAKLKPRGDVNLRDVNLSRLTEEQINALPEGPSVQGLSLNSTWISAKNAMLLIAKLKPRGDVNLRDVNLSRLTEEQINALPEGLFVQDLFLYSTNISAKNAMFLIAKLRPQGDIDFGFTDLSRLKEEDIAVIPEGLSVKNLDFDETDLSAANAMLLIAKLKPRGDVNLVTVDLSELTEEQINALPEGLSVKNLDFDETDLSAANAMLLEQKLGTA